MSELTRTVAGDWFDIREAARSLHALTDELNPDHVFMAEHAEILHLAMEQGVVEYKRTVLRRFFNCLSDLRYKAIETDILLEQERRLAVLIWVTLVQKLMCDGNLPFGSAKPPPEAGEHSLEVSEIISEILDAVAIDPDAKSHPVVKNIMLQVGKYRRESENLKKLLGTAPEDKRAAIVKNSKVIFAEIFSSIKKNYAEFAAEQAEKKRPKVVNPLSPADLKPLSKMFLSQAEEFSRLRSTVAFARREQTGIREMLASLETQREKTLGMVEREAEAYKVRAGSENAALRITRAFAVDICTLIEREGKD